MKRLFNNVKIIAVINLLYYFGIINIISVFLTVIDKHNAKHSKRRIRENTLLCYALLGGSITMYFTMLIIRHKTKKIKFMIGIPIIIILQSAAILLVLEKFL